jgi:two-component system, sensor histidine kinase PdtaS
VHETLSETLDEHVDFDEVCDRLSAMVCDVAAEAGDVVTRRTGSFGSLPAQVATPLAVAMTELMHNAVEHGFSGRPGRLGIRARRNRSTLEVVVEDDGAGLPPAFEVATSGGLGLSIVRTLVGSELGGEIALGPREGGGTVVTMRIPVAASGPVGE